MSDVRPTEFGKHSHSLGGQLEEVCDRVEAAWKSGRRPPIEDYLGEVPETGRTALFHELLVLELTYRRRAGERPTPEEYQRRFPQHVAVIEAVLGAARPSPPTDRPRADADNNLLFGLLALQNNFIDREKLLAAFTDWVSDKDKSLGRILLQRGAVDEETYTLLEAIARKHLQMHDGDPEASLAALSSLSSIRDDLERVADPDLQASLSRVPLTDHRADPNATRLRARADATSTGGKERFRILRLHKTGGLGAVYVAHDEELRRDVALKQICDQHAHDQDSRTRFVQEAEITGRLEHPGIIPVYGLGTYDDGRPFYAMRFIKGDNLKDGIAHFHAAEVPGRDPGERALALRELLRRFLDVCNAMAYAHSRGVLHRDLKPQNILLGPYGETLVVDWGLAKPVGRPHKASPRGEEATLRPDSGEAGSVTRPGDTPGTPAYMSPEQAAGDLDRLGLPSDVYSLGATLYCVLTGKPPFEDPDVGVILAKVRRGEFPPPRVIDPTIDRAIEAVCLRAMALKPEDRYGSPRALADDIERWVADEPVKAWREPWRVRTRRWARRHGYQVVIASFALVLLAVVVAAGGWILYERKNSEIVRREADLKTTLATNARRDAASQQYLALLNRTRANRGNLGWTWTGLTKIKTATGLDTTFKDLSELRTEAADCLMGVDMQPSITLAKDIDAGRVAFSPDGKVLAVAEKMAGLVSGRILIIELNTSLIIKTLIYTTKNPLIRRDGSERIESLAFSPDGRWLATGMRFGRVWLWEWDQFKPAHVEWNAHQKGVESLVFDRDGKTLLTGSNDGVVTRWDFVAGTRKPPTDVATYDLKNIIPGNARVRELVLGEGTLWASIGWGETELVATLDPQTLKPDDAQVKREGCLQLGHRLCLSPDGQTLAAATKSRIRLMDTRSSLVFRNLVDASVDISHDLLGAHDHQGLQFSPDGSLLASCLGRNGYVELWDVASARILLRIPMRNRFDCNTAFSPDGRYFVVPDERCVVLYELRSPEIARTVALSCSWVSDFDWSPDSKSLVWIAQDDNRSEVTAAPLSGNARPVSVSFPDSRYIEVGPYIASHPEDSVVAIYTSSGTYLWNYGRGDAPMPITTGFVGPIAFSSDGLRLWGVAKRGGVDSWPLVPTARATHWADPSGSLSVLVEDSGRDKVMAFTGFEGLNALTADARWVLGAGQDGRTRVLDARDGTIKAMWGDKIDHSLRPEIDPVRSVALSPDGIIGASGLQSGRIWLWKIPGGEEVASLNKHQGAVDTIAFHSDGRLLASGSRDGTVRLWRPVGATWSEVLTLRAPAGPARRLRFSPDGTRLAVLMRNQTAVRIWDITALRTHLTAMGLGWDDDEMSPLVKRDK